MLIRETKTNGFECTRFVNCLLVIFVYSVKLLIFYLLFAGQRKFKQGVYRGFFGSSPPSLPSFINSNEIKIMINFLKQIFSWNQRIQNLIYNKNEIYKIIIFQRHESISTSFPEVTVQAHSAVAVPTTDGANKVNGSHAGLL